MFHPGGKYELGGWTRHDACLPTFAKEPVSGVGQTIWWDADLKQMLEMSAVSDLSAHEFADNEALRPQTTPRTHIDLNLVQGLQSLNPSPDMFFLCIFKQKAG